MAAGADAAVRPRVSALERGRLDAVIAELLFIIGPTYRARFWVRLGRACQPHVASNRATDGRRPVIVAWTGPPADR